MILDAGAHQPCGDKPCETMSAFSDTLTGSETRLYHGANAFCTDSINDRGPADAPHKCAGPKLGRHVQWTARNVRISGEAAEGNEAPITIFGQLVLQKVMPGQLQCVYAANQADF
jgi:hypothetical protein